MEKQQETRSCAKFRCDMAHRRCRGHPQVHRRDSGQRLTFGDTQVIPTRYRDGTRRTQRRSAGARRKSLSPVPCARECESHSLGSGCHSLKPSWPIIACRCQICRNTTTPPPPRRRSGPIPPTFFSISILIRFCYCAATIFLDAP